jgi:serine/threonine protein kinase
MAPEILLGKPYDNKIDVWALGIIFYEMFEKHSLFQGSTPIEVF